MSDSPEGSHVASTQPKRWPLYVFGGVLLTILVVGFWYSDRLGTLFEKTPTADGINGTWVFDSVRDKELMTQSYGLDQQMPGVEKKDYSKTVITFAPGLITLDDGSAPATPTPCRIQGYPPNAYLVTTGEGKSQRELVFQLDASAKGTWLYLSTEGNMVPFTAKK